MSLTKAKKYLRLAEVELKKFEGTGEIHFLLQASEKGWKSATEYLFYKCKKRLKKHSLMKMEARRIGGDVEVIFKIGERLHSNFYHNFLTSYDVRSDLEFIRRRMKI